MRELTPDSTQPGAFEPIEVVPGIFTHPKSLANWNNWRRIKVVSLKQAVFLSFGVEPDIGYHNRRCWPIDELGRRERLAVMNLGPGGAIRGFGDAAFMLPVVLRMSPSSLRVDLKSFADWVISNNMPLATGCPRSPPESLTRQQGQREQQTRSRVLGMVIVALAKRMRLITEAEKKIRVSSIRDAAIDAIEGHMDFKGLKSSTLDKYIAEALKSLSDDWPL